MSKKPVGLDPALTAVTVKYLKLWAEAEWERMAMTTTNGADQLWAVSVDGKVRILMGSEEEVAARDEAASIWPGCTWLGAIAEFVQTPDTHKYFVYNKGEFMKGQ